jgi:hypothetical protein
MKPCLDMEKIAKGLGGERRGKVAARSGYFGAVQLLTDVHEAPRPRTRTRPSTERRQRTKP